MLKISCKRAHHQTDDNAQKTDLTSHKSPIEKHTLLIYLIHTLLSFQQKPSTAHFYYTFWRAGGRRQKSQFVGNSTEYI